MRRLSEQRRKVVVMAASVSVLAASEGLILPRHLAGGWEWLRWVWLGVVVLLLVKVMVELWKLKREEG